MQLIRIAALAAVLGVVLAAPATSHAMWDPFFGVWTDDVSLSRAEQQSELDRQMATGVGVIREHIYWDRIETSPGYWDWRRLDELVRDAADRGLQILPVLLNTPDFYSARPPGAAPSYPPKNPYDMARFAQKLVQRYGPRGNLWCDGPGCPQVFMPITAWQVWNEPDLASWWAGSPDPAAYVRLLQVVSTAIKVADPRAEVVSAGFSTHSLDNDYLKKVYQNGGGLFFDSLAVHPYGKNPGEAMQKLLGYRAVAAQFGEANTPIRVTEYGWPDGANSRFSTTSACQAARIHDFTRTLAYRRGELKIRSIVQFAWNDRPPVWEAWPFYAGLVRVDGSAKPALSAFTEAVNGRPPPPGLSLAEACPGGS